MSALLKVQNLKKYFKTKNGLIHAVDDVSFAIEQSKTLGVVGESGCGKSTLGRSIIQLHKPTSGKVFLEDTELTAMSRREIKVIRPQMQMIFQDPYSSLNPRMSVAQIISEPLIIYKKCNNKKELIAKVGELMDTVGLSKRFANSYPHELDGGRRQRIGIARALSLNPRFVVCDEPVSALDVSIQAQILNLMQDLQEDRHLTYLFITHDLSVVRHISNKIMVMYLGKVVEFASANSLFKKRLHPYTKALLNSIPIPKLRPKKKKKLIIGELASALNPSEGCRFAPRCQYATEKCFREEPSIVDFSADHSVSCHHVKVMNSVD